MSNSAADNRAWYHVCMVFQVRGKGDLRITEVGVVGSVDPEVFARVIAETDHGADIEARLTQAASDAAAAFVTAPSQPQADALAAADAPTAGNPFLTSSAQRTQILDDLGFLSLASFGAIGDGVVDDTHAVQAAFTAAIAQHVELRSRPGKVYKLSDTINIGSAGTLITFAFDGASCGYAPDYGGGLLKGCVFDASTLTDRPAFSIQTARFSRLRNCTIMGGCLNGNKKPSFVESDYAFNGRFRTDRYSPHAGIAIDPYSPYNNTPNTVPPGGGYPGATYGLAGGSFKVEIENVRIIGFVCGVVIQPSGWDGNGSSVTINGGEIDQCVYAVSVCGSQNRNCLISNVSITDALEAVTTVRHGARQGSTPRINGGEWGFCARLFNVASNIDTFSCTGLYCESTRSIGIIGAGLFGAPHSASFTGCNFVLEGLSLDYAVPCILDHTMPCVFNGCNITTTDSVVGIITRGQKAQFNSCLFYCTAGDGWLWLPNLLPREVPVFRECVLKSGALGSGAQLGINTESELSTQSLKSSTRVQFLPTARTVRTEQNTFEFTPPREVAFGSSLNRKSYVPLSTNGAYTFGASTVTIIAAHGPDFAAGDIIYWPMLAVSASVPTELPALRVLSVNANAVMCARLFDLLEYDQTYTGNTVKCAPTFWANNPLAPTLVGAWTNGSPVVLTNIDPRSYLRVGDFVFQDYQRVGFGVYRVVSMDSKSVTLSANAGGTTPIGIGGMFMFGELRRAGGRFQFAFTTANLFASRYVIVPHGMYGHAIHAAVYDSNGVPQVNAQTFAEGSGQLAIDLGANPPTVVGTWTVVGFVLELES